MTVTELTTLQLAEGVKVNDSTLLAHLLQAIQVLEKCSNELAADVESNFPTSNITHIDSQELNNPAPPQTSHKFHVFHEVEDPSKIYLIGSWPSRSLHMNSFIPSDENKSIIELLKSQINFKESAVTHISLDPVSIPVEAPVLVIRHHSINPMDNAAFEDSFESASQHLSHFSKRKIAAGWQVEKAGSTAQGSHPEDLGEGNEMYVLLSGWDDMDHHRDFENSEKGKEYEKLREWIDEGGLEVRHTVRVDLE